MHWFRELFPRGEKRSLSEYCDDCEHENIYINNTNLLSQTIGAVAQPKATLIYEHAKIYLTSEDKVADSITSRGQALLASQAFLAALLSFGGIIASRTDLIAGWQRQISVTVIVSYIIIQTYLLTRYAIISVAGVGFPRISSSELIGITAGSETEIIRSLATRSMLIYRTSAIINEWRFTNLQAAQKALRNTSYALGTLVLMGLMLLLSPASPSPKAVDTTVLIKQVQQSIDQISKIDRHLGAVASLGEDSLALQRAGFHDIIDQLSAIKASLAAIHQNLEAWAPKPSRSIRQLTQVDWVTIQRALASRGYDPGPFDGLPGRRTHNAINAYHGGELTAEDIDSLLSIFPKAN